MDQEIAVYPIIDLFLLINDLIIIYPYDGYQYDTNNTTDGNTSEKSSTESVVDIPTPDEQSAVSCIQDTEQWQCCENTKSCEHSKKPSFKETFVSKCKTYVSTIHSLPSISYNGMTIDYKSINSFDNNHKNENAIMNQTRENIIGAILNKSIPDSYYSHSNRWNTLRDRLFGFFKTIYGEYKSIKLIHKGGRSFTYDFLIKIDDKDYPWEFKFGVEKIDDCPQFNSPHKPSKYLSINFEEWYYDNVLPQIAQAGNLKMPDKKEYLAQINSPTPKCMNEFIDLYDDGKPQKKVSSIGCEFYKKCIEIDKKAIQEYLKIASLDTQKLSDYFSQSQKDKHYILYKKNKFYYDDKKKYDFTILPQSVYIKGPNFICKTKSGHNLEIKLRWKNGNGIAYPAFQVKRLIPTSKELIALCKSNNISVPNKAKKDDIVQLLNKHNISY